MLAATDAEPLSVKKLIGNTELLIDGGPHRQRRRIGASGERSRSWKRCGRIEGKLGNEAFVAKAPEAVIAKEREKLTDYQSQLTKLKEQRETIRSLQNQLIV